MNGIRMDNIFANFLRKDPVTRSINRHIDKRVKRIVQARKNLKEVEKILEVK